MYQNIGKEIAAKGELSDQALALLQGMVCVYLCFQLKNCLGDEEKLWQKGVYPSFFIETIAKTIINKLKGRCENEVIFRLLVWKVTFIQEFFGHVVYKYAYRRILEGHALHKVTIYLFIRLAHVLLHLWRNLGDVLDQYFCHIAHRVGDINDIVDLYYTILKFQYMSHYAAFLI